MFSKGGGQALAKEYHVPFLGESWSFETKSIHIGRFYMRFVNVESGKLLLLINEYYYRKRLNLSRRQHVGGFLCLHSLHKD